MAKLTVERALLKAKLHTKRGEIEEAQALYETILKTFPNNKKAQQSLAGSGKTNQTNAQESSSDFEIKQLANLFNRGQLPLVSNHAAALAKKYPNNFVIWSYAGGAHLGLGRFVEAVKCFRKVTQLNPRYPEGHNNLGSALMALGKYEESLKCFKNAVLLKSDYPDAYYNIGVAYQGLGKLNSAIAAYKKSLGLNPNNWEVNGNLGLAYKETGAWIESVAAYEKALAINPNNPELIYNLGNVLQDQGKQEEAIEAYNKAIAIKPEYAEAYTNMGIGLHEQGKLEEAVEALNKGIAIKPEYVEAHYNKGNALKDQGKLEEAIEAYNKALSIEPGDAKVTHLLSALTGSTTKTAPRDYVEKLFDRYARNFDSSLLNNLGYRTPKLVADLALNFHGTGSMGSILDLGCGTGLLGIEIKKYCSNLKGVDISSKMIRQAEKHHVYNTLEHVDIVEYLSNSELDFDYFISTDVFIYIGELSDVFRLIKSRNKRSGKLIFSTEHTEASGFQLEKSGRYSHSKGYIEALCLEFEYSMSHFSTIDLRKEKGEFITGGLYILDF